MAYKLFCNGSDITDIAGAIEWSDSLDTLGAELTFNRVKADDNKHMSDFSINCGDIIVLKNENTIFEGIVVNKEVNGLYEESYSCFDFLFYLNKNKIIRQVNGESASTLITHLCNEFNIPIGNIPILPTKITAVYYENSVSEIIEDVFDKILEETGKIYCIELQDGKINIFEKGTLNVAAKYKRADNIAEFDITKAIGKDFNKTFSIEEMKNSIIVVSTNDDNVYTLAKKQDESSINRYGLLQEVHNVDASDRNTANNIGEKLLSEYNKVEQTVSVTLIGNDNVRAGRVLTFACEKSNIIGKYLIKSCSHTLTHQRIHTMALEMEVIS